MVLLEETIKIGTKYYLAEDMIKVLQPRIQEVAEEEITDLITE